MIKSFLLAGCLSWSAHLSAQRSIVVLGSSTAEGVGASPGHSWVALTSQYLKALGLIDTIHNLAMSGSTTFDAMPTGSSHPPGTHDPDPAANVTKALSYDPLPKIVIVSFPSNDLTMGYTLTQYLSNLRTIYNTVVAAHRTCFLTTTQPRDDINTMLRNLQKEAADSIMVEYPDNSLDFWDTLADHTSVPDSLGIKAAFRFGDGIHINDAGHAALFQIVMANTALLLPLPLTLSGFSARQVSPSSVLIRWTTADETGPLEFHVQRSADGRQFDEIGEEAADPAGGHDHSWTDVHILPGRSFYRLRISEGSTDQYSQVVSVSNAGKPLALVKLYYPSGPNILVAQVSMVKDQLLHLAILNSAGWVVRQESFSAAAPTARIPVSVYTLAAGQYFLQVIGSGAKTGAIGFSKF